MRGMSGARALATMGATGLALCLWQGEALALDCDEPGANCVYVQSPSGATEIAVDLESTGSSFAWKDWTFRGVDHLFAQSWWYQTPNDGEIYLGAFLTTSEVAADTLTLEFEVPAASGGPLFASLVYTVADSDRVSSVSEVLSFSNTGPTAIPVTLFAYTDFEVAGTTAGDTAFVDDEAAPTTLTQVDGSTTATVAADGSVLPSHWEIDQWRTLLNKFDRDMLPTILSDSTSPLTTDDVTHAFQFDFEVAAGGTTAISVVKTVAIAAPNGLAASGVGFAGLVLALGAAGRRRSAAAC